MLLLAFLLSLAGAYNFSGSLTVSGISAGGFMASQYAVAFSSEVSGVAMFAGESCAGAMMEDCLFVCFLLFVCFVCLF
jgi:hypothetical protein